MDCDRKYINEYNEYQLHGPGRQKITRNLATRPTFLLALGDEFFTIVSGLKLTGFRSPCHHLKLKILSPRFLGGVSGTSPLAAFKKTFCNAKGTRVVVFDNVATFFDLLDVSSSCKEEKDSWNVLSVASS